MEDTTMTSEQGTAKLAWAGMPTSTPHVTRLCIVQPTRRPKQIDKIIETSWGRVRVVGKLGQQHLDVLEAICFEHEGKRLMEDGRIKLLVDPARVRRRANIGSGEQLDKIRRELRAATIQIYEPEHLACVGGLVDHIDDAIRDGRPITRPNPLGGTRKMWRVDLGKAFCKLVGGDIWLGYDPAPIARLEHGISQAVARHIVGHEGAPAGGWHLDGLIKAVAGESAGPQLRDRRREIRADSAGLAKMGIVLDGDRLTRSVEQKPGRGQ
jgi:hypothetical protein